uniref:RING-CH-type domain-containing protein n=1 Tax=Ditylenchus dipsaci TaxID=166011 RepID=A0A915E3C0_9BILA
MTSKIFETASPLDLCRICLDESEYTNFVSPCRCKGSNAFVHEECLNTWIKYSHDRNAKLVKIASTTYDEFHLKNEKSIPREAYASIKKQISIWNSRFRAPRQSETSHVEGNLTDAAVPAVKK